MARLDTDWSAARTRRRTRRTKLRAVVIILIVYATALGLVYVVLRTPLLTLRAVNIEGVTYTDPALIKNALMAQHPGFFGSMVGFRSILAWPTELSSSTRALIPSAQTISISKSYIHRTITVKVGEREPFGIWCFTRTEIPSCLWFDQNGVVYSPAFYTEGSLIPLVRDSSQDHAGDDRRVLPARLLPNFLAVMHLLKDQHIPMREIRITDINKEEVSVPTYGGPELRFSLRFAPTNVVTVIDDLKNKGAYNGLQYIDFRSENRAFYE